MDMDDDDEFGDLYSDVLPPLSSAPTAASSAPKPSPNPFSLAGGDRIPTQNPNPNQPIEALAPLADEDPKDDWLPDNWNDDGDDDNVHVPNYKEKRVSRVSTEVGEATVSGSVRDYGGVGKSEGFRVSEEEIGDPDQEPVIPGLSAVPSSSNGDLMVSNAADDWDTDSDDDLQIVLNDTTHGLMGRERNEDDDDEDGEEDLVIVTDQDQQHLHHQPMAEQDWGEGEMQPVADGERNEGSEAAKVNGAAGVVPGGQRIGYGSHGFPPQHHSMFKV